MQLREPLASFWGMCEPRAASSSFFFLVLYSISKIIPIIENQEIK